MIKAENFYLVHYQQNKNFQIDENIAPVAIIRHAPKEFRPETGKQIDKEFAAKGMGQGDHSLIDNPIKGRPLDCSPNNKGDLKML